MRMLIVTVTVGLMLAASGAMSVSAVAQEDDTAKLLQQLEELSAAITKLERSITELEATNTTLQAQLDGQQPAKGLHFKQASGTLSGKLLGASEGHHGTLQQMEVIKEKQ